MRSLRAPTEGRLSEPRELAARVLASARGRRLVLALDFDGTLAEIVPSPEAARMREDARAALAALAHGPFVVAILSGRSLDDLRSRAGVPGIALAGEHGADLVFPGGERSSLGLSPGTRELLESYARFAQHLLEGTGGHVERKRVAVAAHTRRIAPELGASLEGKLLSHARELAASPEVQAIAGKKIVELRARGAAKDRALRELLRSVEGPSYVVAVGDDATDEDLFRETLAGEGLAIRVGEGPSLAPERLANPEAVAAFLSALVPREQRS